ncbi:unnamed protein product [Paramecium sonneborni]|uniref:UBC core domain-containing protein n=1 Tax=Paramecium sonneborni TaxID=65129 RepID=A0A8S1KNB9_9CILI|nr:unnamed protein product [Paramecium sonneborni]
MQFSRQKFCRNINEQQSLRRLQNDLLDEKLKELNDDICEIAMDMDSDILQLFMTPKIGLYKDKKFFFNLDFRTNYPYFPPSISVKSDIQHPNIDFRNKKFYLKFLETQNWRPTFGLLEIIKAMKQTLLYVDFTYIPNEINCLILAQQILQQNNNIADNYFEFIDFEISENFKINFELDKYSNSIESINNSSQQNLSQQPAIINLQKTQRHSQNDKIICIKQKN